MIDGSWDRIHMVLDWFCIGVGLFTAQTLIAHAYAEIISALNKREIEKLIKAHKCNDEKCTKCRPAGK